MNGSAFQPFIANDVIGRHDSALGVSLALEEFGFGEITRTTTTAANGALGFRSAAVSEPLGIRLIFLIRLPRVGPRENVIKGAVRTATIESADDAAALAKPGIPATVFVVGDSALGQPNSVSQRGLS